jgi:hypothetical protein
MEASLKTRLVWHVTRSISSWVTMVWSLLIAWMVSDPANQQTMVELLPEGVRSLAGLILGFTVYASINVAKVTKQKGAPK